MTNGTVSPTLRQALDAYTVTALSALAESYRVEGRRKGRLMDHLAQHLLKPEVMRRHVDALGPEERTALEYVLTEGGEVSTDQLFTRLAEAGLVQRPSQRPGVIRALLPAGGVAARGLQPVVEHLGRKGLLLAAAGSYKLTLGQVTMRLFVPSDVRPKLVSLLFPYRPGEQPANVAVAGPLDLLRDIYVLVSAARAEPIPLISGGWVAKRALVRLDDQMRHPEGAARVRSESDLRRFPFVRALAETAGLLQRTLSGLMVSDTAAAWMELPAGERLRQLLQAYRTGTAWAELAHLEHVRVTPRAELAAHEPAARARVLAAVAAAPAGVWLALEDLQRRMSATDRDFLLAYQSPYPSWGSSYTTSSAAYARYMGQNTLKLQFNGDPPGTRLTWTDVEGGFIRQIIMRSLHQLAVVDVGGEPDEAPDRFRLTEVGVSLLRDAAPRLDREPGRVVVQPNYQLLAFEPMSEGVLYTLDRFAQRVRLEQVAEFRITAESVGRGLAAGLEGAFMVGYLERLAGTLPQNVRRSIEEWSGRQNRIRVRRGAALLEVHDPAVMNRLLHDPAVAALLAERPAPNAVVIRADAVDALYDVLTRPASNGGPVLPALSEGEDGDWERTVQVDELGVIRPRSRWPSMYLEHSLRGIAEPAVDGTFRITRASLRAAVQAGLTTDQILARLGRIAGGPLPEPVIALVRHGTQRWGQVRLVTTVLLEAPDAETLTKIRADDEIGPLLEPLEGASTIVRVPTEHADRVRALLEDRGAAVRVKR